MWVWSALFLFYPNVFCIRVFPALFSASDVLTICLRLVRNGGHAHSSINIVIFWIDASKCLNNNVCQSRNLDGTPSNFQFGMPWSLKFANHTQKQCVRFWLLNPQLDWICIFNLICVLLCWQHLWQICILIRNNPDLNWMWDGHVFNFWFLLKLESPTRECEARRHSLRPTDSTRV